MTESAGSGPGTNRGREDYPVFKLQIAKVEIVPV